MASRSILPEPHGRTAAGRPVRPAAFTPSSFSSAAGPAVSRCRSGRAEPPSPAGAAGLPSCHRPEPDGTERRGGEPSGGQGTWAERRDLMRNRNATYAAAGRGCDLCLPVLATQESRPLPVLCSAAGPPARSRARALSLLSLFYFTPPHALHCAPFSGAVTASDPKAPFTGCKGCRSRSTGRADQRGFLSSDCSWHRSLT
jgi:hypothetical protein